MQPDPKDKAQTPADSYERAEPEKQSPEGGLDATRPEPQEEPDHLQNQNAAPDEAKVKKP